MALATTISGRGWVCGPMCSCASCSSNHSELWVTTSPSSSRSTTSSPSVRRPRCSVLGMPSIIASDGSRPGPKPNIARPWAWWSSWTTRSATVSGLWYGREMTPVPSRIGLCARSPPR